MQYAFTERCLLGSQSHTKSLATNTGLFLTKLVNPFPNDKILDCSKLKVFADEKNKSDTKIESLFWEEKKTLWEKEKMLVTSIFSFSHNVFGCSFFSRWVKLGTVWQRVHKMFEFRVGFCFPSFDNCGI